MSSRKRLFIAALLAAAFFLTAGAIKPLAQSGPAPPSVHEAAFEGKRTIADAFLDEELVYNLGFWLFEDVASGRLTLKKGENGEYLATLAAHTTGAVDWVLRKRKDTYVAHLKLSDDGKRFMTTFFEKTIVMNGKTKKTEYAFDYKNGVMTSRRWKDGKEDKFDEFAIPPGIICDDPIAALYNFRYGVYGPIEEGREYKIYTFPKKDRVPEITLKIVSREEKDRRTRLANEGYLADVVIDKEFFGSSDGDVEVFFTSQMLPTEAVAKEVLFFGDVRGRLAQIRVGMNFEKKAVSYER